MEGAEVCKTEDAILALLENLVDPRLPAKSGSKITPSRADEEVIAKQMHAVVLLYNYYHRRQHPELKFMNFESFCKLAVILKPNLLPYLKLTQSSNDTEFDDPKKQLSLTERKIADACNIAMSLDASKEASALNGSAVSRVAVLLVDSTKQNALLKFCYITEGVWSVVEKEVEVVNLSKENSGDSNQPNKRKRIIKGPAKREEGTSEDGLKIAATSAVNEATGIRLDGLSFLESHIVYSTSKENTATRFYISQCTQGENNSGLDPVPIKDLIKSLQGPLFTKSSFQWTISPVVEYFHLLPFAQILADWMNSAGNHSSIISKALKRNDKSITNTRALTKKDETLNPDTQVHPETAKQNDNCGRSMIGLGDNFNGFHNMEVDALPVIDSQNQDMCTNITNGIKPANQKIENSVHKSSNDLMISDQVEMPNTLMTQEIAEGRGRNVFKRAKNCNNMEMVGLPVVNSQKQEKCINIANTIKPPTQEIEGSVLQTSNGLLISDKVKTPNTLMTEGIPEGTGRNVAKSAENCNIVSVHPDVKPAVHLPLAECGWKDIEKMFSVIASKDKELTGAALKVLLRKRDKLSIQQRDIEDQIAQYDKKIQTIWDGGDDMALKIESVIELCNDTSFLRTVTRKNQPPSAHPQSNETMRLLENSEDDIHTSSSCQALDDVCCANDWMLPTYRVQSVNGGFVARVIVKGEKAEWSSTRSDVCVDPREARESVAAQILEKICNSTAIKH